METDNKGWAEKVLKDGVTDIRPKNPNRHRTSNTQTKKVFEYFGIHCFFAYLGTFAGLIMAISSSGVPMKSGDFIPVAIATALGCLVPPGFFTWMGSLLLLNNLDDKYRQSFTGSIIVFFSSLLISFAINILF